MVEIIDNIEFEFRKENRKRCIKADVTLEGKWIYYELSPPEFTIYGVSIPDWVIDIIRQLESRGWTLGKTPKKYVMDLY